uniref:Uncharacterized protein n=1 Tax=Cannabis sativa TaxID=3483 RepID=A0A803NX70_CANSA
MLSTLLCMDLRTKFIDETLFLTVDILAAYCMINGSGASSNSLSSSAKLHNLVFSLKTTKTKESQVHRTKLQYLWRQQKTSLAEILDKRLPMMGLPKAGQSDCNDSMLPFPSVKVLVYFEITKLQFNQFNDHSDTW